MIPFCGHYICWYANLRDILFTKDVDWDQLLLCTGTTFLFNASVSAWKFFPCTTYIRGSSGYSKKLSPVITDKFTHPFVSCLLWHPNSFGSFSSSISFLRKQHYMHLSNKLPALSGFEGEQTSSVRFMLWWPFSVLNGSLLSSNI